MRRIISILVGAGVALGSAESSFAQEQKEIPIRSTEKKDPAGKKVQKKKAPRKESRKNYK